MIRPLASLLLLILLPIACANTPAPSEAPPAPQEAKAEETVVYFEDFEDGDLKNLLEGDSGAWNLNPDDFDCETFPEVVEVAGLPGSAFSLKLKYDVDSPISPCQNGYWTKLKNFDASRFDHLEFEIKGDAEAGYPEAIRVELKKYKDAERVEKIKGSALVPVTAEWQTLSIPLNKITGVFDFANPETWRDPSSTFKNLDEFVIVLKDRHLTQKTGVLYFDNFRFVKTGKPGPTPVDFPLRKKEKTPTRIEGVEFAKFLIGRLGGFPKELVVKKKFPADDREFLMEVARDTWRFFDEITDKEHGLVLDTIQLGREQPVDEKTQVGDYTNITNVGVYFMAVVAAHDLGFITEEDAVARCQKTIETIGKLEAYENGFLYNYYDTTTLERTSHFVSLVDSGWLMAGLYVAKNAFPVLAAAVDQLLSRWNLSFFYDPVERLMFHGYYDHLQVFSDYHYGVLYSEPRATSFMAIARGDVPMEHWFMGLARTFPETYTWQGQDPKNRVERKTLEFTHFGGHYEWPATNRGGSAENSGGKVLKYVPSWGGSSFEAFMPALVLDEKNLAPKGLGLNDIRHAQGQARFSLEELAEPVWGMSPSSVPEGGYSEFGAKPFGSKGYKSGVVTPHASALTLDFNPEAAIANLRKLIELYDIYGEYGFYDAVTVKTGLVARKYLALDQAMILIPIANYLKDGSIRKRFHGDPVLQKGEVLLTSEDFMIE